MGNNKNRRIQRHKLTTTISQRCATLKMNCRTVCLAVSSFKCQQNILLRRLWLDNCKEKTTTECNAISMLGHKAAFHKRLIQGLHGRSSSRGFMSKTDAGAINQRMQVELLNVICRLHQEFKQFKRTKMCKACLGKKSCFYGYDVMDDKTIKVHFVFDLVQIPQWKLSCRT